MKLSILGLVFLILAIFSFACQPQQHSLTDSQKAAIADSAKTVVQLMLANADRLDFVAYFDNYSADPDARYIENGFLYPSLDTMKKFYADLNPLFESLKNKPDGWDMTVLGSDAVAITMPFHMTFKPKGLPEYTAQGIWTGVVQRRNGKWTIMQSHESWINPEQVMAALVPLVPKQSSPKK
jgi:hypothetical protein